VKYLGVYIDQHLTWKCHDEYVLRRVCGKLYSINHLRPLIDNVMKIPYHLPIIDYCDIVWVPTNSSHLKTLERVHSRFVSSISTNCPVFKLTLIERRKFHTAIEIYKILIRRSLSYLLDTFKVGHSVRRLFVPAIRLNYGKRSLYYCRVVIWNNLPAALTNHCMISN